MGAAFSYFHAINVRSTPKKNDVIPPQTQNLKEQSMEEASQNCTICLEPWTNSSEHRLVSLRCGHLFGQNCITHWLEGQNGRCPQCNASAKMSEIRNIYAKAVKVTDCTNCDQMTQEIQKEKDLKVKAIQDLQKEKKLRLKEKINAIQDLIEEKKLNVDATQDLIKEKELKVETMQDLITEKNLRMEAMLDLAKDKALMVKITQDLINEKELSHKLLMEKLRL